MNKRKQILCLGFLLMAGMMSTQAQNNYKLKTSTGTYSDLSGTTSINDGEVWDYAEYAFPIGFTFNFLDAEVDSFFMDDAGFLYYSTEDADLVLVLDHAIHSDRGIGTQNSLSPLSYKLEGTAGNRIFKLELKNMGFFEEYDEKGTTNDFANIQLWLYEKDDAFEIKYGASKITNAQLNYDGADGPLVGFGNEDGSNIYILKGNPANPTLVYDTTGNEFYTLDSTPANGTTYRFEKTTTGYAVKTINEINLFPNPASTTVQFEQNLTGAQYSVFDMNGRLILSGVLSSTILDIQSLEQGQYQVQLTKNYLNYSSKLIKQ